MIHDRIKEKLAIIKSFQTKYPTSHVGGSIGLLLHGIDLQRDLKNSDIDITVDVPINIDKLLQEVQGEISSAPTDFDHLFTQRHGDTAVYSKIEIRVCPEPSFEVISFDGVDYNVSLLRNILYWKQKYADKGFAKHIEDLGVINTGVRTTHTTAPVFADMDDDLPF